MLLYSVLVFCGLFGVGLCGELEAKVVPTDQGLVKGYKAVDGDHFTFFGIPYATAPLGQDKFKAPLPPPTWQDEFEATDGSVTCPQGSFVPGAPINRNVNEDCLKLNIYVPNTENHDPLPVIVYVHGGAYQIGYGNMGTPENIITHDVIVVNFNYRLGVHGFLCLGTKTAPGNAGMKDQVAALRWVKRNIANFGGDPEDITIAGYSAGSAAVELLMLSPTTRGLFKRVISESGSALSAWSLNSDPLQIARKVARDLGATNVNSVNALEDFYTSLTIEELISKVYFSEPESHFGIVPCIENEIHNEESFLLESPLKILTSGEYNRVPYLTGFAQKEGLFRLPQFGTWKDKMNEKFSDFLPADLSFVDDNEKEEVAARVKSFYFNDRPVNNDTIHSYVDYFSDVLFTFSVVRSARLHARNSVPVYLYEFSYAGVTNPPIPYSELVTGANHCAQSFFLQNFNAFGKVEHSDGNKKMQQIMSTLWVNFAKYGEPTPSSSSVLPFRWSKMNEDETNYLSIDTEIEMRKSLLSERIAFWDEIYKEHYSLPHPPAIGQTKTEL